MVRQDEEKSRSDLIIATHLSYLVRLEVKHLKTRVWTKHKCSFQSNVLFVGYFNRLQYLLVLKISPEVFILGQNS